MIKEEIIYSSKDEPKKVFATIFIPDEGVEIIGVLQIVHGMVEHIGRYEEFASFLTSKGFVVAGEDHLGHGRTGKAAGEFGYFAKRDGLKKVLGDIHELYGILVNRYENLPYYIMGHSMGSFFTRNYIAKYPSDAKAAIIMGTGHQPKFLVSLGIWLSSLLAKLLGDKHVSKFIDALAVGSYNKKMPNKKTGYEWLTKDEEVLANIGNDEFERFTFTLNGYNTMFRAIRNLYKENFISKVPKELPILFISGGSDPVGDYGKGVIKAAKSLKNVGCMSVDIKIYEDDRHEVLNETNRAEVYDYIYEWLSTK